MKIRVLHIMSTITRGGVERRRLSLAKYLDKSRYEMKLIGTIKEGDIAFQIEENGVEVIEVGNFKNVFAWKTHKKVQKVIEDFQPHIIHGAVFEGVTLASINGFCKRVPITIIEETSDPQNRSWRGDLLIKLFSCISDKAVAIAPNVADYLLNVAKVSKEKIITINNGVEIPRTVSAEEIDDARQKYNIAQTDFVVGTVGRLLNDHKKFTDILLALAKLDYHNVKLLIVGGGKDEQLIKDKIVELDLGDRVIMTGYQYDTALFYKLMDVFCIASQREGFGLVAAEAMLHHLPVIATRVGGLQNVVKDNETGFLIPPNSPQEIAAKILKLYQNKELRLNFGRLGYKRGIENYTEKRYVKDVECLYDELLKKKGIGL